MHILLPLECWNSSDTGTFGKNTIVSTEPKDWRRNRSSMVWVCIQGMRIIIARTICMFMFVTCMSSYIFFRTKAKFVSIVDESKQENKRYVMYHPPRWPATGSSDNIVEVQTAHEENSLMIVSLFFARQTKGYPIHSVDLYKNIVCKCMCWRDACMRTHMVWMNRVVSFW